ncbi:MAG: hypothetical protein ACRC3B_20730, partial [Bacteroidia bacterium]
LLIQPKIRIFNYDVLITENSNSFGLLFSVMFLLVRASLKAQKIEADAGAKTVPAVLAIAAGTAGTV